MSDLEKCLTLEGQVNVPGFSFESFYNRKGEFDSSRAANALARAKLQDEGARGRLNRLFNFMAFWGTKKEMLESDTPLTPDLSRVAAVRGVRTKSGSKGSASEPATPEPPSMATSSGLSGGGADAVRAIDAGGPKEKVAPGPVKGEKLAGLPTLPGYDAPFWTFSALWPFMVEEWGTGGAYTIFEDSFHQSLSKWGLYRCGCHSKEDSETGKVLPKILVGAPEHSEELILRLATTVLPDLQRFAILVPRRFLTLPCWQELPALQGLLLGESMGRFVDNDETKLAWVTRGLGLPDKSMHTYRGGEYSNSDSSRTYKRIDLCVKSQQSPMEEEGPYDPPPDMFAEECKSDEEDDHPSWTKQTIDAEREEARRSISALCLAKEKVAAKIETDLGTSVEDIKAESQFCRGAFTAEPGEPTLAAVIAATLPKSGVTVSGERRLNMRLIDTVITNFWDNFDSWVDCLTQLCTSNGQASRMDAIRYLKCAAVHWGPTGHFGEPNYLGPEMWTRIMDVFPRVAFDADSSDKVAERATTALKELFDKHFPKATVNSTVAALGAQSHLIRSATNAKREAWWNMLRYFELECSEDMQPRRLELLDLCNNKVKPGSKWDLAKNWARWEMGKTFQDWHNKMMIASWNINGWTKSWLDGSLLEYLQKYKPDVLFVSEVKSSLRTILANENSDLRSWLQAQGYSSVYWHWSTAPKAGSGNFGSVMLSRVRPLKTTFGIGIEEFDREGRVISMWFKGLVIVGCYGPCSTMLNTTEEPRRMRWEQGLRAHLLKVSKTAQLIWIGDHNVIPTRLDCWKADGTEFGTLEERRKQSSTKPYEIRELRLTTDTLGLTDAYRIFNTNVSPLDATWSNKYVALRIDHHWIAQSLWEGHGLRPVSCEHIAQRGSDHAPVHTLLTADDGGRGDPGKEVERVKLVQKVADAKVWVNKVDLCTDLEDDVDNITNGDKDGDDTGGPHQCVYKLEGSTERVIPIFGAHIPERLARESWAYLGKTNFEQMVEHAFVPAPVQVEEEVRTFQGQPDGFDDGQDEIDRLLNELRYKPAIRANPHFRVSVGMKGRTFELLRALADSGAFVSLISKSAADRLGLRRAKDFVPPMFEMANGSIDRPEYMVVGWVRLEGASDPVLFSA